jgi:hypothetical protein
MSFAANLEKRLARARNKLTALDELRRIAEAAPQPGPWIVDKQGDRYAVLDDNGFWVCDVGPDRADAAFIAAFNPKTAVMLLDKIEKLEKQVEAARDAAQIYAARVNDLGAAVDDNDPAVMVTAQPIGAAQADLYMALGIYEDELARMKAGPQ